MIFAPGNKLDIVTKALRSGSDAVIIDFEDAVPYELKECTRKQICNYFSVNGKADNDVFIRMNGWHSQWGKDDFDTIVQLPINGIILPKAENLGDVEYITSLMPTTMELIPLIETAAGVLNSKDIVSNKRVSRLAFGAVDFTADIGTTISESGIELLFARSLLVLVSRAADKYPPLDTVFTNLQDEQGFHAELEHVKQLGMFGKLIIHPKQIKLAHSVFSPSAEEVAVAREIISAYEQAEASGAGAIEFDGKMIDYPVFISAKNLLELYRTIGKGSNPDE